MGFLNHIQACNSCDPSRFVPFWVEGRVVGQIKQPFCQKLGVWSEVFLVSDRGVEINPVLDSFTVRSEALAEVLEGLRQAGEISHLHGELYGVANPRDREPLLAIDRAAAPYFGICAYGQHLNGYVRDDTGLSLWIGRRAGDRRNYPGKLDNLVAGGLPYGISLKDNLLKECQEEAAMAPSLVEKAVAVGEVAYCREVAEGLKPDTLYCYDLELPRSFVPRCMDGEVEAFQLLPVEQVMETVATTEDFKLNCNLVLIDFFIRHGYIEQQNRDYLPLIRGLRSPLIQELFADSR